MKSKMAIAYLLLFAGLCFMLYPWIHDWYFERQKQHMMEQWLDARSLKEAAGRSGPSMTTQSHPLTAEAVPAAIRNNNQKSNSSFSWEDMEGILTIPSIDLRTPILSDISDPNLNMAVCRLAGPRAGEYGNYCLAGHKSRMYGRHFNRLHEVSTGAHVTVETAQAVYVYQITGVFAVTAEDHWVLEDDYDKKQITLITCDYSRQPVGRLIVRGELDEVS